MALAPLTLGVLLLCLVFRTAHSADFKKSECFDSKEPNQLGTVTLTCPEHYVISVDDAFFGRNKWGACIITDDDCVEQTAIFKVCDGQVNCTRTFKTYTKTCGYSTMLELGYSCIRSYKDLATPAPVVVANGVPNGGQPAGVGEPNSNGGNNADDSGQPDAARPQQNWATPNRPAAPPDANSNSNGEDEETGVIVAYVVASVVTVIFLIIAIVMVARRLLQKDGKGQHQTNSVGDCESICIKMDCLPCCGSRSNSPRENSSHDLRMRKKSAAECGGPPPHQPESKLRVGPVGEESCALSEGEDTANDGELGDRADDIPPPPTTSSTKRGKSNPGKPPRQKQSTRGRKHSEDNDGGHERKNGRTKIVDPYSDYVVASGKHFDNDNTLPSSSNRNLMPPQSEIHFEAEQKKSLHRNDISSTLEKPHGFDAVAIPNTLQGTAC